MSGGADNLNGDLWSYITGADKLKRTEEERDILKKAARYFAREPD